MKRKRKKEKGNFDLLLEEFNIKRSMSQEWKAVKTELQSIWRSMAKK